MKKTIEKTKHGYFTLEPKPSNNDLESFYKEEYFNRIKQGGNTPEIKRQIEKERKECQWIEKTIHRVIAQTLERSGASNVLDIGSGTGALVEYLRKNGFKTTGIEPSKNALTKDEKKNKGIFDGDYKQFYKENTTGFDAITMINILNHVRNPNDLLMTARSMLRKNGVIIVRVPNDFSVLQQIAHKKIGGKRWWVADPEHISYFNFESLHSFIESTGFYVTASMGDYPMEYFLLAGKDYTKDKEVGDQCHRERIELEMSIPLEKLTEIYRAMATVGIGRNCFVVARKKEIHHHHWGNRGNVLF